MEYSISVYKKEYLNNVILEHYIEVGSKIEWDNQIYKVKEIIIHDPIKCKIELKCSNVTNVGKQANIKAKWS